MADQAEGNRKAQLVYELERSRSEFARSARGVRRGVSVTAVLKRAVVRRKLATLVGAVVAGLVLTRLLFRKKKADPGQYAAAAMPAMPRSKEGERAAFLLGVLGLLVTLVKPAVTSFLSRKIADYASGDGHVTAGPGAFSRR